MPVLLARDEVNGLRLRHRAEHAPLTHPTALRKDVPLIASPALSWQGVERAHTLLLGPLPFAPEGDETTGVLSFVVPGEKPFSIIYLSLPWDVETLKSIGPECLYT
jgi:hypothetical protein